MTDDRCNAPRPNGMVCAQPKGHTTDPAHLNPPIEDLLEYRYGRRYFDDPLDSFSTDWAVDDIAAEASRTIRQLRRQVAEYEALFEHGVLEDDE